MSLKIKIIGTAHPLRGGLAAYNERLAEVLQEEGHDVEIYNFSLQYPSFLFPGKTQYSSDKAPEKIRILSLINSVNPLNWIRVGWKLFREKPDLIIIKFWLPFMGPCFGTILRIARWNKHSKIISIIDNIIPHEKRAGDWIFAQYFTRPVHGFIAMSKSVLKDLELFTNKKQQSIFIPHPIYDSYGEIIDKEEARKQLKIPVQDKIVLFFGFIRDYKGLDLLLEAMSDPRIKKSGVKALIAGEFYNNESQYHNIINALQLSDRLILKTEFIPNNEVNLYFSAADLLVQPYKTATQSGISQMAYHFELPMVVTEVGGLPEIVHDKKTGFVVKKEPESIADAIIDYFENYTADFFLPHIQEEKKKYSWQFMTKGIIQLASLSEEK